MNPIPIPPQSVLMRRDVFEATFGPPEDSEEVKGMEDCGTLAVLVEKPNKEYYMNRLHSYWQPTDEEKERLRLGQPVRVTIFGSGMPPVAIGVGF